MLWAGGCSCGNPAQTNEDIGDDQDDEGRDYRGHFNRMRGKIQALSKPSQDILSMSTSMRMFLSSLRDNRLMIIMIYQ